MAAMETDAVKPIPDELSFNVTGDRRKALVAAVSNYTGDHAIIRTHRHLRIALVSMKQTGTECSEAPGGGEGAGPQEYVRNPPTRRASFVDKESISIIFLRGRGTFCDHSYADYCRNHAFALAGARKHGDSVF